MPLLVALLAGEGPWVAYAVLAAILGFMLDTGGSPAERLGPFVAAGLVVLTGTALGTLASGNTVATTLALAAAGVLYAFVEATHASAAFAGRFLCLTVPIGALYAPVAPIDVAAVAAVALWGLAVSLASDAVTGRWRPATAPHAADLVARLRASGAADAVFALIVGVAVAAAFLTVLALGLDRANWALFAVVVILRSDRAMSRRVAINIAVGTPIGVAVALAYGAVVHSPAGIMAGMAVAALLRWPADALNGILGIAALTAFILLLFDLVAMSTGLPSHAPEARLVDVTVGCAFAAAATAVNRIAMRLMGRTAG